MADTLDPDVQALKEWLRGAWRQLADPSLTRFEQRELRNYMKDAERALHVGLRRIVARDFAKQEGATDNAPIKRPNFRLLAIDT